jgi:protein-tyrosine kinase
VERIRDAVQRARLEGAASAAGFVGVGPTPLPAQKHDEKDHASQIAYTTTRTLNVAYSELREKRIVSAFEPCIFTDAYKILSTQVSHRLRERQWNTLAITSPGEREGKTLTAVNLAISLAKEFNQTALLVDADLRHPGVRDCLRLPPGPGLSDYLLADASIEQLLVNPGIPGFVVLPGGNPQPNSSEILGWRKMTQLVHELKQRYQSRIVLFDLPPLLSSADVLAFAPHVQATLLVVEEGKTSREDVARAAELIGPKHLLGTVLNKTMERGTSVKEPQRRLGGLRRSH